MLLYMFCVSGMCTAELSRYYVYLDQMDYDRLHRRQAMVLDFVSLKL